MKRRKNGFTLIELIAVLVILAIIALIVTPLVMNIVKKAKDSANKRSVDAYGKAVELAVATHLLDTGDYPTDLNNLTVEYSGNEVVCNVKTLNEDGSVYLSECSVKGAEVKDSNTEDGWYHYGKTTKVPSEEPVVYQTYNVGDVVTYNGMEFYVIENSGEDSDHVTMLKAEPLTVDEVNTYGGVGTDNNHVNMYVPSSYSYYQTADNLSGYGGMQYYSSSTCGYDSDGNFSSDGCTTDYAQSEVKHVVDAWSNDKITNSDLVEDETGYSVRLIKKDDLVENLDYEIINNGSTIYGQKSESTPSWVYNSNYRYWTMSPKEDSATGVWNVIRDGNVSSNEGVSNFDNVVRPVITLLKSSI